MNPFFIIAVFAILISFTLFSIYFPGQKKLFTLSWINILCWISFVLCGWYFNQLTVFGIFLYAVLWLSVYWISLFNIVDYFPFGHAVLATLISSIVLYVIYKADLLFHLTQGWLGYSATFLFGLGELLFLLLLIFFTWDTVHALSMHLGPCTNILPADRDYKPFVSIHLPVRSEPVDVVSKTLDALARLSYPTYEVIVVDNNTDDPSLWMPIKERCEQLGFQFVHVNPHPGYKAGALNLALAKTSVDAHLVAVVDADYTLNSNFLEDNVAAFRDPRVGFLQTSQRNQNVCANRITRVFNPIYDFFYDITMLARSQRNSIIFAGCAGLIRCSALRDVGGWAEWSITEDAELSLRLLERGYKGVYVNRDYGSGLMPETFEDVRKQWFRYFFGGLDIARHHLASTLLARNKLSFMQRLDFLTGGIFIIGAAVMLISTAGLIITALTYSILQIQNPALAGEMFYWLKVFSSWLLIYNSYQAFGMFLLFLVFRLVYRFRWLEAVNAAMSILSLATTQAWAAFRVFAGRKHVFVKTPKQIDRNIRRINLTSVLFEILLCLLVGTAMLCLFWTASSKPVVLGYVLMGLWQISIYASTVWRAFQSPRDRVHSLMRE